MISFELAKELKEVRFPFGKHHDNDNHGWCGYNGCYEYEELLDTWKENGPLGRYEGTLPTQDPGRYSTCNFHVPTLSELMSELGYKFDRLEVNHAAQTYHAFGFNRVSDGGSPEEALAKLWLTTR